MSSDAEPVTFCGQTFPVHDFPNTSSTQGLVTCNIVTEKHRDLFFVDVIGDDGLVLYL